MPSPESTDNVVAMPPSIPDHPGWKPEENRNFAVVVKWLATMTLKHRAEVLRSISDMYCVHCGRRIEMSSSVCVACPESRKDFLT